MSNYPVNRFNGLFAGMPQPGVSQVQPGLQAAPVQAYAADQLSVAQTRDPAAMQALAHYSQQLRSANPVDVTMALASLEGLGPVWREDVNRAVLGAMQSGLDPISIQEMSDYLIRNQVAGAAEKLQMLSQSADTESRAIASQAYAQLITPPMTPGAQAQTVMAPGMQAGAPQLQGAQYMPGQAGVAPGRSLPGAPGVSPSSNGLPGMSPSSSSQGMPTSATGQAGVSVMAQLPDVTDWLVRLRDFSTLKQSEAELRNLATPQLLALTQAAFSDGRIRDRTVVALVAVLNTRVKEPGVMDMMRMVLRSDAYNVNDTARARAAVALACFGKVGDLGPIQQFLVTRMGVMSIHKEVVLECLAKRSDLLKEPSTVAMLKGIFKDRNTGSVGIVAMRILAGLKTPEARDTIGESSIIAGGSYSVHERLEALKLLSTFPKPYSERTLVNLKLAASDPESLIANQAKSLLGQGSGESWWSKLWPFGKKN